MQKSKPIKPRTPRPGENAVIFGRKGSGKTTLAKRLLAHHSRCLIVDPLREYADVAVQVASLEELADYLENTAGRWRAALTHEALESELPEICELVRELGDCLLVLEETSWFCDPYNIPDALKALIQYGRHQNVSLIAMARRPSEVHRMVTSEAWEVYCFALQEPRDLDYIRRYVGDAYSAGLPALPPLTYRWQSLWDRSIPAAEHKL